MRYPTSAFVTKALVEEAVEIIRPGIEQVIKNINRVVVCLEVVIEGADGEFTVWGGTIGNPDPAAWGEGKTYILNAHAKARMALRNKEPNHVTLRTSPQKIEEGDFKYYGGDYRNGIGGGGSGLAEHQDYLAISMLLAAIEALCMREFEKALTDKSSNFFC